MNATLYSLVGLLGWPALQEPATTVERVGDLGHPGALHVVGATSFTAHAVANGVVHHPDFFEASSPWRAIEEYRAWLETVVNVGYRHAGFAGAEVAVRMEPLAHAVEIEVVEGTRLRAAEVDLEGSTILDTDWLRAALRAGSAKRIARSHLPAPPGPGLLEPTLRADVGIPDPPAFWVPGEPAPIAPFDLQRFERLATEAAHAAGLHQARVEVRWDVTGDEALPAVKPVVEIAEGPLSRIRRLQFEGSFEEPSAVVEEWAAIPPDTPATMGVMQAAVERVRATGRFGSVTARWEPLEQDREREGCLVDLILSLEQAPAVGDLANHPTEEMVLLRRMAARLGEEASNVGLDLRLRAAGETSARFLSAADAAGVPLAHADGDRLVLRVGMARGRVALELLQAPAAGGDSTLLGLWVDDGGGALRCPPLGLRAELPAVDWQWMFAAHATYARREDPGARPFDLGTSFGFVNKPGREVRVPLLVSTRIEPSALLYLLMRGETPTDADSGSLERTYDLTGGQARLSIDRADARLSLVVQGESPLGDLDLRFGQVDAPERPAWVDAEDAPGRAVLGMDALRGLAPGEGADTEWILVLAGLQALVSEVWSGPGSESPKGPPFVIPRADPGAAPQAEVRNMMERVALGWIESTAPGSWPTELARAAPLLLVPASPDELTAASHVLGAVARHPDLGPVGAWLAAELCALGGQPGPAAHLAGLGSQRLSADAFLRDCEALFGLGSGPHPAAIARALRELHARATESDPALPGNEIDMLRDTFDSLATEASEEAWLRAGLTRLWESSLRDPLAARLESIGARTGGR